MKRENIIKVKINNLKLAKQISRIIFKDIPMKEKIIENKRRYSRKVKYKNIPE